MVKRIIGIDFGTSSTFMKVKRYDGELPVDGGRLDFKPVIFDSGSGSAALPTVIQLADENGRPRSWYGLEAEAMHPGGIIHRNFKVDLESKNLKEQENARTLTKQMFSFLFQKYQEQRQFLGETDDEEETIVSYPAKWKNETQHFMLETAKQAGFPNVRGVDEATASISAVLIQKREALERLGVWKGNTPFLFLVIDMGAGTTDLAVCRYIPGQNSRKEVIATWPGEDDSILFGGQEIDLCLAAFLTRVLKQDNIPEKIASSFPVQAAEQIKSWKERTLCDALNHGESVTYCNFLMSLYNALGASRSAFSLDRTVFEELLSDYLRQFPRLIQGCMAETAKKMPGFTQSDIDMVILTGGHSQWYFVQDMLTGAMTKFGDAILPRIKGDKNRLIAMARPQEIVSLGLVYQPLVYKAGKEVRQEHTSLKRETEHLEKAASSPSNPVTSDSILPDNKVKRGNYDPNREGCAVWMDGWIYFLKENSEHRFEVHRMREDGSGHEFVLREEGGYDPNSRNMLYAASGCLYLISSSKILQVECGTNRTKVVVEMKPDSGLLLEGSLRVMDNKAFYIVDRTYEKKSALRNLAKAVNPIVGTALTIKEGLSGHKCTLRITELSSGRTYESGFGFVSQIGIWEDKLIMHYHDKSMKMSLSTVTGTNRTHLVYQPIQSFFQQGRMQMYKMGDNVLGFCVKNHEAPETVYFLDYNDFLHTYPERNSRSFSIPICSSELNSSKMWFEGDTLFYLTYDREGKEKEFHIRSLSDFGTSHCKESLVHTKVYTPEMVTFIGDYMYDFEKGYTCRTHLNKERIRQRLGGREEE